MEVISKLKRWILKRNDRLFQGGKILRAKLSKLRLDNDYDGVKASELADEAELIFDKAALTEAIMRKRDVGETLSRDEVVHMYELAGRGLMDDAEGAPALLKVANIDPFAHLDEGNKERFTKDVDGLAQLRFDDLVKGFHVCIVEVAAMIDIITIAISAVVLKAMTPRATA